MSTIRRSLAALAVAILVWGVSPSLAQPAEDEEPVVQEEEGGSSSQEDKSAAAAGLPQRELPPLRPAGSILIPEHFVRAWDPVTLFFDANTGPAKGGAEDNPARYVTMAPSHPGAFTWLDARTLQFRPTIAWPPLEQITWRTQGRTVVLMSPLSAPLEMNPRDGAQDEPPLDALTLTFPTPLPVERLAQALRIELRPLPGIGAELGRFLGPEDFAITALEQPANYRVAFARTIPEGMRVLVHLRVSPDEKGKEEAVLSFSTAPVFQGLAFGCRDEKGQERILPEGQSRLPEQARVCSPEERELKVSFSEELPEVSPIDARNFVHISPPVDNLRFTTTWRSLTIQGDFKSDTLYQFRLETAPFKDKRGRSLRQDAPNQMYVSFPAPPRFIQWRTSRGIAERFGPQMVPVQARGAERVDLRIQAIDPLDRSLWVPFARKGIEVDESIAPPAPGEEPRAWGEKPPPVRDSRDYDWRYGQKQDFANRVQAFGSPSISELSVLPLTKGGTATFGLDLKAQLARIRAENAPGHYLVGIRLLAPDTDNDDDSSARKKTMRQWMRLQVTDLSVTVVEEAQQVNFAVTSLATGQPVGDAEITLAGASTEDVKVWETIASLKTAANGMALWEAPGDGPKPISLVVRKGDDVLIFDLRDHLRFYTEYGWNEDPEDDYSDQRWLNWTSSSSMSDREEGAEQRCHLFSERPIYRPEEPVHIKGYLRTSLEGKLQEPVGNFSLLIKAPGEGPEWRIPVEPNALGSIYHKFAEKTEATGIYTVTLETKTDKDSKQVQCNRLSFKKEAYKLPTFEVQLQTPQAVPLDALFEVGLTAEYYAGGLVAGRPVHWRVTQEAFGWIPKAKPGFVYSSDRRFSSTQPFRTSPVLEREDKTDAQGAAKLILDPSIEPTAQPREYVIEASVTGDDDRTVTNTQRVQALPPFVLGLSVPRFLENAEAIEPVVLVENAQGQAVLGQAVTVRLVRRQWNAILQATDFSQGSAKYITETVDEPLAEQTFTTAAEPTKLRFPIKGAGVFIVEVESQDKLGRSQTVKVDLFAGGERPATWERPPAEQFSVSTDKAEYNPGEDAKLLLQSPFQTAAALAIVEHPNGQNVYKWVPVKNGYATFVLPIEPEFMPRLPVHFVLMRGRIPAPAGEKPEALVRADLRKPATLAATQWVKVSTVKNLVKVDLAYPSKALPGQEVDVTVRLRDDLDRPLAGEVTLWMVDQAVLALAREASLDPLPPFIRQRPSKASIRDTRNLAFGLLPLQEEPGGDSGEDGRPLERVTVRKNFTPVPYYEPNLKVGPEGTLTVRVPLPDSLTNFKLRAKAVSGFDRFGFGTGHMQVRLPLLVQPSLPRFVRPGDSFDLAALGRVVDGQGGPGQVEVKLQGLEAQGPLRQETVWEKGLSQRFAFPVKVPIGAKGAVDVTVGVARTSDGVKDAFQIALPVLQDRDPLIRKATAKLTAKTPVTLPAVAEKPRAGTVLQRALLVGNPELVAMASGLDTLVGYPCGCTEQRISRARAALGARQFNKLLLGKDDQGEALARSVEEAKEWIALSLDKDGLVSFWPGEPGTVSLTAWSLRFMVEARQGGFAVDEALTGRLVSTLKRSLRSDYRHFIDQESWFERAEALAALSAAGQGDPAYAAELARTAQFLPTESLANVAWSLARSRTAPVAVMADLRKKLRDSVIIKLDQGREVYGGLQERGTPSPLILPSEARTLAALLRAGLEVDANDPRNGLLAETLIRLGQGDGWGNTNANAEATLALAEWMKRRTGSGSAKVEVAFGSPSVQTSIPTGNVEYFTATAPDAGSVTLKEGASAPLAVWNRTEVVPVESGSTVASSAQGFAVERELWTVPADGSAGVRLVLDKPGTLLSLALGDVVEDHVTVVSVQDRTHVAIVIPLAAGMEPMNPNLATSSREAIASRKVTLAPSNVSFQDDRVSYFYSVLPKGAYHFAFRSRATVTGTFIQPPAMAKGIYNETITGNGNGSVVTIRNK